MTAKRNMTRKAGLRIALIVEGDTEKAFVTHLRKFLSVHLHDRMPKLDPAPYDGRIPTGDKLRRTVLNLLNDHNRPADCVIALTDVYTGTQPPDFKDAADAKERMRAWVGQEPRFFPHAAQYDFEAWLLPYWSTIQKMAEHNRSAPSTNPESVNHSEPPAHRIMSMFQVGKCRGKYVKPRDADRILRDNDLGIAIDQCPELKAFINTILTVCGAASIP